MKTYTKGNVIVEEIKVGDIHYEYEWGVELKTTVQTLPVLKDGKYTWKSITDEGKIINYVVDPKYPSCYSVNLYDYQAYKTFNNE